MAGGKQPAIAVFGVGFTTHGSPTDQVAEHIARHPSARTVLPVLTTGLRQFRCIQSEQPDTPSGKHQAVAVGNGRTAFDRFDPAIVEKTYHGYQNDR